MSGGLGEKEIKDLKEVVDLFGVGTYISNSPVVDFAMDIVEIEHKPYAKRGKKSGKKTLLRCKRCGRRKISIYPAIRESCQACGGDMEELMKSIMKNGEITVHLPSVEEIRNYVMNEIKKNNIKETI